jgi:hypothetical protein
MYAEQRNLDVVLRRVTDLGDGEKPRRRKARTT